MEIIQVMGQSYFCQCFVYELGRNEVDSNEIKCKTIKFVDFARAKHLNQRTFGIGPNLVG